jgi:type III restriction enzyme
MNSPILESIVNDISFDSLPIEWQNHNFASFSKSKRLYNFQQKALENAIKALCKYYIHSDELSLIAEDKKELKRKEIFFKQYLNNGLSDSLDFEIKKTEGKKSSSFLIEYYKDYLQIDGKINFKYFINRMSFWMATGSGKTLIIVKLLEILHKAISNNKIPINDILFLAHRDDLIDQFIKHVDEFNQFGNGVRINLYSLRDYENVKRSNFLPFGNNEINIFYYRSDLLSNQHKEKMVNFKDYDNGGKWYVLLDEAHKGDKEDSKRQIIYSILSRNGFLFNFSATFTDPRDFSTCVFNFNLEKFINEGYGKNILLSEHDVSAFLNEKDFSLIEKQKTVLKTFILLSYIQKNFEKIKKFDNKLYHKPLLLTLVNSVNTEDADLLLFFKELEKIGKGAISQKIFNEVIKDIIESFNSHSKYLFQDKNFILDEKEIYKLKIDDIIKYVFNSNSPGKIEVLTIPNNKKELIFKLKTSDKPFGSIKIGDISGWLKDKLSNYEINESYDNESFFENINRDNSNINILMGSRSFYEGWDSNRPNLLLFINIGLGNDAKKFVLQSVGRGVRIEPLPNRRSCIQKLYNSGDVPEKIYNSIIKYTPSLETLFIFGTNANNMKEVITSLQSEQINQPIGAEFIINPAVKDKLLLIPIYKDSYKPLADENDQEMFQKFFITIDDLELSEKYFNYLNDKIILIKHNCEPKIIEKLKRSFEKKENFYNFNYERLFYSPDFILDRIINHYRLKKKEFSQFKSLEDEIIHFKKIKYTGQDQISDFLEKITQIKQYNEKAEKEQQLEIEFDKDGDKIKYKKGIQKLEQTYKAESNFKDLKIKYIYNHYYIPLILSDKEKINYINHIITIPSEKKFIKDLEQNINNINVLFSGSDWWLFSKLDEYLDEIYIPYFDPNENRVSKFKPDFIFWIKKNNEYRIIFIDPKGTENTSAYRKIDGYKSIFEDHNNTKNFFQNNANIKVNLLLYTNDLSRVPSQYKKYWFDNNIALALKNCISI